MRHATIEQASSRLVALGRGNDRFNLGHGFIMRHNPASPYVGKTSMNPFDDFKLTVHIRCYSFTREERLCTAGVLSQAP